MSIAEATARILIVDDHPANVLALREVLLPLRQPIVVARSGEEAVECADEDDFAVILMDVTLPGMDGLEAAATIRKSERTRRVPIIFLTAVDRDAAHILRSYAQGGVDYLVKPFDAEILRSKVAVFVDLHLMREQAHALAHVQALGAVAEAERARFYSLFMQAPVAIAIMKGPDHTFELANPLYCEMVSRPSLVGKRYLEAFPELAGSAFLQVLDRVYQSGAPFMTSEYHVALDRRGDGKLEDCFFKFSLEPLRDSTGEVYGQMAVAVEISAQVRARRELAESLEREKQARAEAERAVRLNELFVGILGHDLRNPMSAIAMGSNLLLRIVGGEKELRITRRIVASAERMARMIDQLLDFTRIRAGGGLPLNRDSTDLYELCERVVEELETAHPERNFSLELQGEDPTGVWDSDLLLQALSNLVGNAVDHGAADRPIRLRVESDGETVSAAITNEGVVPPQLLPVLFDPFRGSERRDKKGLGLGLFITQQIAVAHGGAVTVDSSAEAGTTFRIVLPRATKK